MTRDGGTKKMKYTAVPLGLLGLLWLDLTRKAWNQTLTYLRLPGLKLGNDSHNTRLLQWVVMEFICFPLTNKSLRDFPLRYDMRGGSLKISLSRCWFLYKVPFSHCIFFSVSKAGWYCLCCVTKGSSFCFDVQICCSVRGLFSCRRILTQRGTFSQ